MEIDRRALKTILAIIAATVLISGSDRSNAKDGRDAEIVQLRIALAEQQGARAADLAYAERQVGIFRGCTFLFNVCSESTTRVAQEFIKIGVTGDSSPWWWIGFIDKVIFAAGFVGALLWLPWHLRVVLTRPAQEEIQAAKNLIAGMDSQVRDANRKRTQTQQEASAIKRDLKNISLTVKEKKKMLADIEAATAAAHRSLTDAKAELAELARLRESFKKF